MNRRERGWVEDQPQQLRNEWRVGRFHPFLQRLFLGDALFGGVFADVFGDLHRAEVGVVEHLAQPR